MNPAILGALTKAIPTIMKVHNALGMVDGIIKVIGGDVEKLAKTFGGRWYEMNDIAFKTARTMAMSREQAISYNKQLINSTRELAAQYGITAKELADFQQSYAEAVGRNVILTREQLSHMSALSKITDSATASKLVDEFDKVGVGIARATAYTGRLQERAKALGVSPAKATKMMADNIRLASSYSFRNGVKDIEKMSMKAASMRMDMNAIMSATEKFADIEGAISTSANIQMLGGSFAREFSNPMGAMFESMADPQAFQERIFRTIQGKGRYDAKTGAVTFDPVTMRMMRELANNLGMTVDQITNPAMAEVQNQKVDEELKAKGNFENWGKTQLEAIRNLSRTNVDVETGKHFVTYLEDGKEKRAFIEDLTAEQLDLARDSQETEEGLWRDVQDIKTILERVHGRARETKSMKEGVEGAKSWWDAQIVNIQDIWMKPISGIWNGITNWLGKQYYADGGIVEKPIHAEFGTMVPGDSYSGDKVHAMVNSGEMILNPMQQKSMFNLISSLALNGGMAFGMNKLGGRMGYGGLGSTMLLGNMIGGGNAGLKEYVEAHFIQKFIKNILPFKESIKGVSTVTSDATKSTSLFKQNWKELTSTLSKDWKSLSKVMSDGWSSFARRVSIASRRYFTTGKWGQVTSTVGNAGRTVGRFTTTAWDGTAKYAKVFGNAVYDKAIKPLTSTISTGWNYLKDSKFGNKVGHYYRNRVADAKMVKAMSLDWFDKKTEGISGRYNNLQRQAHYFNKDVLQPKTQQYKQLVKNLFNDGSNAQASKLANRVQTPEVAMTGRITGAAKEVVKEGAEVGKAVGKGGKILSNIGKVGKFAGKFVKPLAAVGAIAGIASDVSAASSQYDARIDDIERSGMSEQDKARAKDRATKQKNTAVGGSVGKNAGMAIGGLAGAAKGAALGSFLGPVGTIAGGLIGGAIGAFGGEKLGGLLGKGVGSLFGGSEEKKFKQEQKELFGSSVASGDNTDLLKTVKSIDSKMPSRTSIAAKSIALSPLAPIEMASAAIKALPDLGIFKKVSPSKNEEKVTQASSIGKTDINLNVSGTIKLEGGGKSVDFDIDKLLKSSEFKDKLTNIILERTNQLSNAGKRNMESERNNMASQYNKSGK